jgi:superfamily I DNA and RNA helicase
LLQNNEAELRLSESQVFLDFPIYKELDGGIVSADFLVVSKNHGIMVFALSDENDEGFKSDYVEKETRLEQLVSSIYARLLRNKSLRKTKTQLGINLAYAYCGPSLSYSSAKGNITFDVESEILSSDSEVLRFVDSCRDETLSDEVYKEMIATIDGSKGLLKAMTRRIEGLKPLSKGAQVAKLEREISLFDKQQRLGYILPSVGPQRIRGLAGSGKTVILAMKAAQTHLRHPDADMVFTFSTKSLYEHVKRLITRFYRQFDDRDPNWEKVRVMHAWGGRGMTGVYYEACQRHDIRPMTLSEAKPLAASQNKLIFDYVCEQLTQSTEIRPLYDYIFIDEGQDFSKVFINLCRLLAREEKIVWAYDELQNIFNVRTPTQEDIFGVDEEGNALAIIKSDIILHKCYRSPREILVLAHALGFGLYSKEPVQMLEDRGHWEDLGYRVIRGDFIPGSNMEIERPVDNSALSISNESDIGEIVACEAFDSLEKEIAWVASDIKKVLDEGLRPEDVLIIVVDDWNFKIYAKALRETLQQAIKGISIINTQADPYAVLPFQKPEHLTISTIHKAKGNEAYVVYVLGADNLFGSYDDVNNRNKLFTAMTRAKGWVRITGIGDAAKRLRAEISKAKSDFPAMKFSYPSDEHIRKIKRDLSLQAIKEQELDRMLDAVLSRMTVEEIRAYARKKAKTLKKD